MTSQPDKVLERILQRFAREYNPRTHGGFYFTAYREGLTDYGAREQNEDTMFYAQKKWEKMTTFQQAFERQGMRKLMKEEAAGLELEIPEREPDKDEIPEQEPEDDRILVGAKEIVKYMLGYEPAPKDVKKFRITDKLRMQHYDLFEEKRGKCNALRIKILKVKEYLDIRRKKT